MVNCNAGGSCNGGNPVGVYEYAYRHGIPDSSCMQYSATNIDFGNPHKTRCEPIDICRDCKSPAPAEDKDGQENCFAVPYKPYYASDYYYVSGVNQMKADIYKYGPISCGIYVTDKFQSTYKAGEIYSEKVSYVSINHEVSIVGWGVDDKTGTEYWVGRNSWGTYWGEYGFFKIQMHKDNLGIETDCSGAIPSIKKPHSENYDLFVQ